MTAPMIAHRSVTYRGATIAYRVAGPVDATTIIMLPPAFCDGQVFDQQLADLSDAYRVLAVDLPGQGGTTVGRSGLTMADAPGVVLAVLDAEGVGTAHVVGVSLGSLVAQAVADRAPERVASLTVVGGYSIHQPPAELVRAQRREGLRWGLTLAVSMERFRRHVVTMSAATDRGREVLTASVAGFRRAGLRAMSGTGALMRRTDEPMRTPLLVVVGAHDIPLAHTGAQALHALVPGSTLTVVGGAGHCVNVDAPAALAVELLAFIDRVGHTPVTGGTEHGTVPRR